MEYWNSRLEILKHHTETVRTQRVKIKHHPTANLDKAERRGKTGYAL
jgi:hypothetical protein